MARLRYVENARTGDAGSVCTNDSKLFFDDTGAYIYASPSGTLNLVATTVAITGDITVSGSYTYGSGSVPLSQSLLGTLTVGINDTGYDVLFYGASTNKYWLWDESADGVVLVGSFTQTGAATISSTLGVTGNTTVGGTLGITGTTTCAALTSVGAVSLTGAVAIDGDVTMATQDQINFEDTATYIHASATNVLTIIGPTIELTGAITITGAPTITGDVTLAGASTFATGTGNITLSGAITIADTKNIALSTGTGTKIGTATNQKIGFFNATPVIQGTAYTQTYSTGNKTVAAPTCATMGDLVATQNSGWGSSTEAGFDKITTAVDELIADNLDLRQAVTSIIDDLQALGLVA